MKLRARLRPLLFVVVGAASAMTSPAYGEASAQLADLERDTDVAEAEMRRVDEQYRTVPELFGSEGGRADRQTWGEIYYLQKEYDRASALLFGAVEPTLAGPATASSSDRAAALYYLADSLFLVKNYEAARTFFAQLLELPNHSYQEQSILRLMEIAAAEDRFDLVDRYFETYLARAKRDVPGQVRYLRGKSLFFSKRDDAAMKELAQVPASDAFALRSRYLMGAVLVRAGKYDEAIARFTEVAFAKPLAKADRQVKEMAHLARGRLLYELDKLVESIDAYQEIPYDSALLTTMLYEVTWTYVRRGQLALRGKKDDNLTDLQRRELAKVEYEKALSELQDLKALEPDNARAAEIDILAGNLRLQRNEFERARAIFVDVLNEHSAADLRLKELMSDRSSRDRVLEDIVAMSSGGLTVDSALPPIVARRAASNEDVAQAVAVFKAIQKSRADVESTTAVLTDLEARLSADNPGRAELFKPLRAGLERSTSLDNSIANLRKRLLASERALSRPSADLLAQLGVLSKRREALEAKVASLPQTADALATRKKLFAERLASVDRLLHQAELESRQRRAELTAVDFMMARETQGVAAAAGALKVELRKNQVREARAAVQDIENTVTQLKETVSVLRNSIATMGGHGSQEDLLKQEYSHAVDEERALLASARDPASGPSYSRLDALVSRINTTATQNAAFRQRLDQTVEERLTSVRTMLGEERAHLSSYLSVLAEIDARAGQVRDRATELALDRVRYDLSRIVLRADVGVVDTSFARKQAETEKIGQLQRSRAAELTDLTQAYADLTKDEAP